MKKDKKLSKKQTSHTADDGNKFSCSVSKKYEFDEREDAELFSTNFRPKYDQDTLYMFLQSRQVRMLEIPLDEYEQMLLQLVDRKNNNLNGKCPSFESISEVHSIKQLKKIRPQLTSEEKREIKLLSQSEKKKNWNEKSEEYSMFKLFVKVINGLISKFSLITMENYNYRIRGRATIIKCLDLIKFNRGFVTIDCLWVTTMIHQKPFVNVLELRTKQLAYILQKQVIGLFELLFSLCPEEDNYKNHILYIPGFLSRILNPSSKMAVLRRELVALELAYRTFEAAFIENILTHSFKYRENSFPYT